MVGRRFRRRGCGWSGFGMGKRRSKIRQVAVGVLYGSTVFVTGLVICSCWVDIGYGYQEHSAPPNPRRVDIAVFVEATRFDALYSSQQTFERPSTEFKIYGVFHSDRMMPGKSVAGSLWHRPRIFRYTQPGVTRYIQVNLPLSYCVAALFALSGFVAACRFLRQRRMRGVHCCSCGYSLDGIEGSVCPECGAGSDG